jgi:hypothetical protein
LASGGDDTTERRLELRRGRKLRVPEAEGQPEVGRADVHAVDAVHGKDGLDRLKACRRLDHRQQQRTRFELGWLAGEVRREGAVAPCPPGREARGLDDRLRLRCAVDRRHDDAVGACVEGSADELGSVGRHAHQPGRRRRAARP